jgi:hypothetical protein
LDNSGKYETAGTHPSAVRSEPQRRPCPDHGRRLVYPWLHRPPVPLPLGTASCGYKGSALPTSSAFLTFFFRSSPASTSHCVVPTLTAAALSIEHYLLRPSLCPTVASLSSTARWCTSVTLLAPALAPTTPLAPHRHSSSLDACRCG